MAPRILNLGTRRKLMALNTLLPRENPCALDNEARWTSRRSKRRGETSKILALSGIEPDSSVLHHIAQSLY
jgi:hypothetical protein